MKRKIKLFILVLVVVGLSFLTHTAPRGQCFFVRGKGEAYDATILLNVGSFGFGWHYGGGVIISSGIEEIGTPKTFCKTEFN